MHSNWHLTWDLSRPPDETAEEKRKNKKKIPREWILNLELQKK